MLSLLKIVTLLVIFVILILTSILLIIRQYGKKYILKDINTLINAESVIVLGAGVRKDGNPCDLLADRIKIGVESFMHTQSDTILLTGEERDEDYNEVKVMKNWITKNYNNIKEEVIILDGLGLCTYDSMYRAKKVFKIDKAIIATNSYHLPRAIYIARKLGIEAYGIASDLRQYDRMKKYRRRELMAQVKDFFMVNIKNKS